MLVCRLFPSQTFAINMQIKTATFITLLSISACDAAVTGVNVSITAFRSDKTSVAMVYTAPDSGVKAGTVAPIPEWECVPFGKGVTNPQTIVMVSPRLMGKGGSSVFHNTYDVDINQNLYVTTVWGENGYDSSETHTANATVGTIADIFIIAGNPGNLYEEHVLFNGLCQ
jgi:hypothetical protein